MFQAKTLHLLRSGTNKGNSRRLAGRDEGRVFAEKTVAGVDRLGATGAGNFQDFVAVEVGVGCTALAEAVGFIGLTHMQTTGVDVGVDRHGSDAHFAQGTNNSGGDGTAVGNQYFLEHAGPLRAVPLVSTTVAVH